MPSSPSSTTESSSPTSSRPAGRAEPRLPSSPPRCSPSATSRGSAALSGLAWRARASGHRRGRRAHLQRCDRLDRELRRRVPARVRRLDLPDREEPDRRLPPQGPRRPDPARVQEPRRRVGPAGHRDGRSDGGDRPRRRHQPGARGAERRHREVVIRVRFRRVSHKEAAEYVNRHFGDETDDPMTEQNVSQINSRFGKRLKELLREAEDPPSGDQRDD